MAERLKRWIGKTTPETVAERLRQSRDLGVEKQGTWQPQLHELNMRVKALMDKLGISAIYEHYYISAAQEWWKLRLAGAQGPINAQADGIAAAWTTRGLDFDVLRAVAGLLGYSPRPMMLEQDCPGGAALCDLNPQDVGDAPSPGVSDLASRCDHVHRGPTRARNTYVNKCAYGYQSIIQGTFIWGSNVGQYMCGFLYNSPAALNDEILYKFSHKQGSYTFVLHSIGDGNRGILTISIDGVSQGTIDVWNGRAGGTNVLYPLAITITADGDHTLSIKVTGKNAGSGGFDLPITAWYIRD